MPLASLPASHRQLSSTKISSVRALPRGHGLMCTIEAYASMHCAAQPPVSVSLLNGMSAPRSKFTLGAVFIAARFGLATACSVMTRGICCCKYELLLQWEPPSQDHRNVGAVPWGACPFNRIAQSKAALSSSTQVPSFMLRSTAQLLLGKPR
jgi:hypothetical protein